MNVVQSYTYYEGFDVSGNSLDVSGNNLDVSGNATSSPIINAKENMLKKKLTAINNAAQTTTTSSSAASGTNSDTSTTSSESFRGREGFCTPDRELNMLRGKQSNTIPILNNARNQDDNVSPSDKSLFSSSYSSF